MTPRHKLLPTFSGVPGGGSILASIASAFVDLDPNIQYGVVWLVVSDTGISSTNVSIANGTTGTTPASPLLVDGTPAPYTDTANAPKNPTTGGLACSAAEFVLNNLIGQIRVVLNGNTQRTMSAFELNRLNQKNSPNGTTLYAVKTEGTPGTSGFKIHVPIFFWQPWRQAPAERTKLGLNLVGGAKMQIQVDFQPGCNTPAISGYYEYQLPTAQVIGLIEKWNRQSLSAAGSNQNFNSLPTFVNATKQDFLCSIALFPTLESTPKFVNKAKFTVDGVDIRDLLSVTQQQAILIAADMTPDTAATPRYDVELDYSDPIDDALPLYAAGAVNLYVEYNTAANGTMIAVMQRVGLPD